MLPHSCTHVPHEHDVPKGLTYVNTQKNVKVLEDVYDVERLICQRSSGNKVDIAKLFKIINVGYHTTVKVRIPL